MLVGLTKTVIELDVMRTAHYGVSRKNDNKYFLVFEYHILLTRMVWILVISINSKSLHKNTNNKQKCITQ